MNLPISFYGLDRFYQQHREEILQWTDNAFKDGHFLDSSYISLFEKNLAQYCHRTYAVTVSSCTDALLLSLKALNIKKGDEVIIPAFSFIASLSPVLHVGAVPVFIDVNKNNLTINADEIKNKITSKTKAIIIVQLFGGMNEVNPLEKISSDYHIPIMEDAAQSLGAQCQQRCAGSLGAVSCISFDPSKTIHAFGTGGVVLTDDATLYLKIKRLHYHGKENDDFVEAGFNSRISSSQAALLNWQLGNMDYMIAQRTNLANEYKQRLSNVTEIQFPNFEHDQKVTYHKFAVYAEKRDELKQFLLGKGIQTNVHYHKLLYEYSLMQQYPFRAENIIQAYEIKAKELTLPLYPELTQEEINYICSTIKNFYV